MQETCTGDFIWFVCRGDYQENSDIDFITLTHPTDQQIEQVDNRIYDPAFEKLA